MALIIVIFGKYGENVVETLDPKTICAIVMICNNTDGRILDCDRFCVIKSRNSD